MELIITKWNNRKKSRNIRIQNSKKSRNLCKIGKNPEIICFFLNTATILVCRWQEKPATNLAKKENFVTR